MILISLILFSFLLVVASFGVTINDVSPSSDLYPYVAEMVQDNIMSLDSSGNFNGALVVTRADLARILSRLLNYVQGRIQPVAQVTQLAGKTTTSATSVALSAELSLKIQKINDAMQKYSNFEAYVTSTASSLNEVVNEIAQLKVQLDAMQKLVSSLTLVKEVPPASVLSETVQKVDSLSTKLDKMSSQMSTLSASVENVNVKVKSVKDSFNMAISNEKADISNLRIKVNSISSERQESSKMISKAVNEISSSASELKNLSQENETLRKRVSTLESRLGTIYLFQALELAAVVAVFVFFYTKP